VRDRGPFGGTGCKGGDKARIFLAKLVVRPSLRLAVFFLFCNYSSSLHWNQSSFFVLVVLLSGSQSWTYGVEASGVPTVGEPGRGFFLCSTGASYCC
jgi:hypothetical protein